MTRSDESAICVQRMAVAVSVSQSFVEDVAYTKNAAFEVDRGAAASY